jgi:hypothetical protein
MEDASFSSPTLTTVRQPLQEVGATAARLAMQQLDGVSVAPHTVATAALVIRESCGCRLDSGAPDRRSVPPGVDPKRTQGLREVALRERVRKELAHSRLMRELGRIGEDISAASDHGELERPLTSVVQLLGLRRLLLATYSSAQRHARVTLESSSGKVVFHPRAEAYPSGQIFPPGFLRDDRPQQLSVQALRLGPEQFGYLLLDGDMRDGYAYLELRRLLSGALARMSHSRELRRLYKAEKKGG